MLPMFISVINRQKARCLLTVKIFQAFLIAFTSDFIQKIVYKYEYGEDGKMDNYVMFTLSKSPEKNWIDSGQVRLIFFLSKYFSFRSQAPGGLNLPQSQILFYIY